MSPSPPERPGPPDPGTERMPRMAAGLTGSPTGDDTGPVGLVGSRAAPPGASRLTTPPPELPGPSLDEARDAGTPDEEGTPPQSDAPPSRAGRNLRAAIGVGLSLAAIIVASLLVWRPLFLGVLVAAVLIGVYELTKALEKGGFRAPLVPLLVGGVVTEALAWTRGPTGLVVGFLVTALAVLLWRLADGPAGYLRDASAGVLADLYVPLLAGFAVLLLVPEDGATRVLLFIATVVASDVGGYAAGVLFGKHPMAPSISPKKSWEGMAGSVVACVLLGTLLLTFTFHAPWWSGVIYGVAIAASATIGDLGESLIKRDLGIKDMGHLLPGHGGIMDRLDSLLPSAAVAYLLLSVLAPV